MERNSDVLVLDVSPSLLHSNRLAGQKNLALVLAFYLQNWEDHLAARSLTRQ
ncbi:hypothetical protein DSUL_20263 [Desulfovibrionales bacterium]